MTSALPGPGSGLQRGVAARADGVVRILRRIPLPLAFVILAVPVGTFLVFAQPPGQGLDETVHFYRVWTLAHGAIVAPTQHGQAGGNVSQCVVEYLNRFSAKAAQPGPFSFRQYWHTPAGCSPAPAFEDFRGSAVYSPMAYIPALVPVAILRGLGAPFPMIFFAGRLVTLLAFVGLYYLAIRITPIGKQVFFVLGLLPTTLLLASSYSADPMTISLAALAVGLTLRCCRSVRQDRREVYLLFAVVIGLALTKPTYFVFALLFFMLPASVVGGRHPLQLKAAATVVTLGCAGIWNFFVRNVQSAPFPLYGLNPHKQMQYIIDHPIGYVGVLARTIFESTGEQRWLPGFFFSIGYYRPFNADNIYAPIGVVLVGSLTVFLAFRLQFGATRVAGQPTKALVWLPVVLTCVGALLIETTLFIYGTPVGLPEVNVEGRYFYPLVLLPLVTIGLLREPRPSRRSFRWIVLGSVVMLIWLVLKIFVHDYSL